VVSVSPTRCLSLLVALVFWRSSGLPAERALVVLLHRVREIRGLERNSGRLRLERMYRPELVPRARAANADVGRRSEEGEYRCV
jgi:hypothetical protein